MRNALLLAIPLLAALAAVPHTAGAFAREAPGGALVVPSPERDTWVDDEVEEFLLTCRGAATEAFCGCMLRGLEERYWSLRDFDRDSDRAAEAAEAAAPCMGLLPKDDR